MNSEKKISIFLLIAYIIFTLLVLCSIYKDSLNFELTYKVLALISLAFLYLTNAGRINIWYLLVLASSIVSDALFVFQEDFRLEATILLLLNRIFYIMIIRHVITQFPTKRILSYFIPFIVTFSLIFYGLSDSLGNMFYPVLIFGFISSFLALLSFISFLNKQSNKNFYFFLGIIIILLSDIFMALTTYLNEKVSFIIAYHLFYYVARYLIYKAMVIKKPTHLFLSKRSHNSTLF